ncbi:hypothetical protein OH693_03870 [Escherichia coli]|nr:hypothetical protein [Escherichia coli]
MYANGLGVNQDYQQSKLWYEKAAAQNDVDAQFLLGRCMTMVSRVQPRLPACKDVV